MFDYAQVPTREVDWRWRLAKAAISGQPIHDADEWVQRAIQYLQAAAQPATEHPRLECPIAAAAMLRASEQSYTRWTIEAYVLADLPASEIAAKVQLTPAVIEAYEQLFFDCRAHLAAKDWIAQHAIRLDAVRGAPSETLGALWRSQGYQGGPIIVDAFIAASLGRPLPDAYLAALGPHAPLLELCMRMKVSLTVCLLHVRDRRQLQTVRRMYQELTAYEQQLTITPKEMGAHLAQAIEAMAEEIIPHQMYAASA